MNAFLDAMRASGPLRPALASFLLCLLLGARTAGAQANGDVVVTVRDELNAVLTGASFRFHTDGFAATQTVADGSANDADGANNGTIVVSAATMAGFGAQACDDWLVSEVNKVGFLTDPAVAVTATAGGGCGGPGGGTTRYHTNRVNTGSTSLAYTVRVNRPFDQFGNLINLSSATTTFTGLTLNGAVSYSANQAYLPASPAAPGILRMTRAGFLTVPTTANVAPSALAQTVIQFGTGGQGAAIFYNVIVSAQDELGNDLTLTTATATFAGLSLTSTTRFSNGDAYLAADPAVPERLTLGLSGYVNTASAAIITPNSTATQTLNFQPTGGQGAGLPFTVFVRAWDELNFRRVNLASTNTAFNALTMNGTIRYSDSSAYIPLTATATLTLSHRGYLTVSTAAQVVPSATVQDTVDYRPGAANQGAGLPFSFRLRLRDATGSDLNGARVDILNGSDARVKDVNGDSIWTSPSPSVAATGFVYIPLADTLDNNATLALRAQHTGYLADLRQHLLNELNTTFQIQRQLQFGAALAAPTLRDPQPGEVVQTLRPTLKWNGGAGAESFQVVLTANKGFTGSTTLDTVTALDTLPLPRNLTDRTVYYWRVRALGQGGNAGPYSDAWSFLVALDTIPPSVILPTPAADSLLTGTVAIAFTATDNDSVATREISVDGSAFAATSGTSSHAWNTTGYPDGIHTLQIRAVDRSGNATLSRLVAFRVDNSPPTLGVVTVRYPGDAVAARRGASVLVQVTASDALAGLAAASPVVLTAPSLDSANRVSSLKDDGKDGDIAAGDGVFSILLPLGTDSAKVAYTLRAVDALGHDTTVSGSFSLDLRAPSVTVRFEPAPDGSDARHGDVWVDKVVLKGTVSDAGGAGLASLRVEVINDSGSPVQNSPVQLAPKPGAFSAVVSLVPGRNRISVIAADSSGNSTTVAAELRYADPKASGLVQAAGGQVFGPDGSGVIIGPDALYQAIQVTVRKVHPSEEPKPREAGTRLLGVPREFGPDKTVFRKPVTVVLAYTAADLDPNQDGRPDFDASKLVVVFWDGQSWVKAGEPIRNPANGTVSVAVNHFTLYDLAQVESASPAETKAYWTRNPLTASEGSTFIYALPAPGKVSLHVLDLAGDVVREIIPKGATRGAGQWSEVWRGDNVSGRFAGAGLYVYVFKYTSDDGQHKKLIRQPLGVGR